MFPPQKTPKPQKNILFLSELWLLCIRIKKEYNYVIISANKTSLTPDIPVAGENCFFKPWLWLFSHLITPVAIIKTDDKSCLTTAR